MESKTLVYFASGHLKKDYHDLPFDKIYLVDYIFRNRNQSTGKIICLGMDCLESIEYFKSQNIVIDYFVSLNEGIYEGGGSYGINTDMFLGYAMQIFNNTYHHIMYQPSYSPNVNVSMDLPYNKVEINKNEPGYIDPFTFSTQGHSSSIGKVYKMSKFRFEKSIKINPNLEVKIIHDSIWLSYDILDCLFISFLNNMTDKFFLNTPKVVEVNKSKFYKNLEHCVENKLSVVGFTPWNNGQYRAIVEELKDYKKEYPKEIRFYHLNKNDYEEIKNII